MPVFRRYTISIEGGTLPVKVERVFEAVPGENRRSNELLATDLGPGKYNIDCFLHTQYVKRDGTNMILNESAMTLEVER